MAQQSKMIIIIIIIIRLIFAGAVSSQKKELTATTSLGVQRRPCCVCVPALSAHCFVMCLITCLYAHCLHVMCYCYTQLYLLRFFIYNVFVFKIQWKVPRLPFCWLRQQRGCNQSSGCFNHNPACLCLAFPIKGTLITGSPTGKRAARWFSGEKGGADTPLQNASVKQAYTHVEDGKDSKRNKRSSIHTHALFSSLFMFVATLFLFKSNLGHLCNCVLCGVVSFFQIPTFSEIF